jgi:hypothetical protein
MELLDLVFVAEAVTPPPTQVIYAVSLHTLQQLPPTVRGTHQFLLFLGLRFLSSGCAVLRYFLRDHRYTAEIALALQYNGLVCVLERIFAEGCLRGFVTLR